MYKDQIIFGIHPVQELVSKRLSSVEHVYFEKDKKSAPLFELLKQCRKSRLSYNQVPELQLRKMTGVSRHQGVAALCSVLPYYPVELLYHIVSRKKNPLFILPASIEDTGNLGAIIRSSAALGADALLLERKHTAPLNASVAKSSAGMVEHIPVCRPKNLEGVIEEFKNSGFQIIGAEMNKGRPPRSIDFRKSTIFIIGGEHRGIPPYLKRKCTTFTSIPMVGDVASLNVSTAAAILLYEVGRQRSDRTIY